MYAFLILLGTPLVQKQWYIIETIRLVNGLKNQLIQISLIQPL